MYQKVLAFSSIILLIFLFSPTYVIGQTSSTTSTTTSHTTTLSTTTSSTTTSTTTTSSTTFTTTYSTTQFITTKYYKPNRYGGGSRNNYGGYNNNNNNGYNNGDDGYNNNNNNNNNNGYNNGDDGYYETGRNGIDSGRYGTDTGDSGSIYDNRQSMLSSMDIWISSADDWEQKDSGPYNKQGKYKKSKKGKNYNNEGRNKRSYSRVRFPTQQVRNYRQIPFGRMPPLISIFPWLPIFYDKITYQTFIFSPTGGIYIIPPLINFYGQRFAVAQLIKWGYASLVSTGAPPPPNVDVAPLVQPAPAGGPVTAGVVGSAAAGPAPAYDAKKHRFNDGVKTDFPNFKPRYAQNIEDGGNSGNSNYGGTRNQQVFPQGGGQRNGGGAYYN